MFEKNIQKQKDQQISRSSTIGTGQKPNTQPVGRSSVLKEEQVFQSASKQESSNQEAASSVSSLKNMF